MKGVVLVVDDSAELRSAVEALLREHGYEVVCAADGARGLALLPMLKRPAVAIVDYAMPAMDGSDVVAHAIRDPRTVEVPIIMLTGDATAASKLRGIFALVRKPFTGADLVSVVNKAFASLTTSG